MSSRCWPALKTFNIHTESAAHLPSEAVDVAKEIARIPNPGTRKTVTEAILTLVKKYFEVNSVYCLIKFVILLNNKAILIQTLCKEKRIVF
jgi:hypothetical protein